MAASVEALRRIVLLLVWTARLLGLSGGDAQGRRRSPISVTLCESKRAVEISASGFGMARADLVHLLGAIVEKGTQSIARRVDGLRREPLQY